MLAGEGKGAETKAGSHTETETNRVRRLERPGAGGDRELPIVTLVDLEKMAYNRKSRVGA